MWWDKSAFIHLSDNFQRFTGGSRRHKRAHKKDFAPIFTQPTARYIGIGWLKSLSSCYTTYHVSMKICFLTNFSLKEPIKGFSSHIHRVAISPASTISFFEHKRPHNRICSPVHTLVVSGSTDTHGVPDTYINIILVGSVLNESNTSLSLTVATLSSIRTPTPNIFDMTCKAFTKTSSIGACPCPLPWKP